MDYYILYYRVGSYMENGDHMAMAKTLIYSNWLFTDF